MSEFHHRIFALLKNDIWLSSASASVGEIDRKLAFSQSARLRQVYILLNFIQVFLDY